MKVKINNRLECVASFVEEDSYIIDVGCDHALLDIYLLQNKKNIKAIASDIKEGPLVHAKENIKKYQLTKKIEVKLGNGIETINENVDTIIISGMGGLNIIGILKYKTDLMKNVETLILSPNNDADKLRKEISKIGYYIKDESLVLEKGFFYPVICFKKGKKKYKREDYLFGPILIQKKEPEFFKYMKRQVEQKEKLLEILPKKYIRRRIELKKELKVLKKYL